MNISDFAKKLRSGRERLGRSQEYVAKLIFMTQSAYSRMENGETNPGVERSLEIIKILERHGFNEIPPIQLGEFEGNTTIQIRWPWNKYVLYSMLGILVLVIIDYVLNAPGDFSRGFEVGYRK